MAASHMSGLPVRPSAVPSFRFMYSDSTRSDLDFESQACATSIVPSIATWLRHRADKMRRAARRMLEVLKRRASILSGPIYLLEF
jgi:hypothetical protein